MNLDRTEITNIGGIDHLVIDHTSPVMLIVGDNGTGKTSIRQAYELVFDGGNRPDFIKDDESKGTVELTFDDGTVIQRTQTRKYGEYRVTNKSGAIIKRPAEFVQKLVSGITLNPMALITADKKKRVEIAQQIMPISFTKPELDEACRYDTFTKPELSLEEFDALVEGTRLKRRDANSNVETLESTIQTLKQSQPAQNVQDTDWGAEVARLETEQRAKRSAILELDDEASRAVAAAIEQARRDFEARCEEIRARGSAMLAKEKQPLEDEFNELTAELATARQHQMDQARIQGAKQQVASLDAKHLNALKAAEMLDRAVKGLEKLRIAKLEQSPIPGFEIRNGEWFFEGKNFDTQLNLQKKVFLVCRIAARADRGLNLFVLDDFEHVTETYSEEFFEGVKNAGFQLIAMRAEKGKPLTLEAK